MVDVRQFEWWLVLWAVALAVVLGSQRKRVSGAGLVLAYALQLWVIHWLAASIYVLPWYSAPNLVQLLGLQESTYAIWGFAVGAAVLPRFVRAAAEVSDTPVPADPRLVRWYLGAGIAAYVIQPTVHSVPTIGALASVASNLLLVALVMEVWNGMHGPRRSIARWGVASALLPFVTIITQGFLGYGFAAMLVVLAFVACVYRPRWKVVAAGAVVSYLALSVYVTYMRDRPEIRAVVWGQESYSVRLDRIVRSFSNFELLDLGNIEHLQRIDDRLNQNSLVGAAILYLEGRPEQFARGSTIWEAVLAAIPRVFWPDKPIAAGSGDLVSRFTGIRFAEGTSVGIGHVMEWYVNFGTAAVVLGSMALGFVLSLIDRGAIACLKRGDGTAFPLWYLPALSLLQVGGSLAEAVSGAGTGLVIGLLIRRFGPVWLGRRRLQAERPADIRLEHGPAPFEAMPRRR